MRNKYYTSRDPIKNYFPLPNEVFDLGLSPGALAVYSYLMYIEDRTTYQCHASYRTIGSAVNMSPNTVRKYVTELVERGLIKTERTTIITQDGRKQNGSLLYTLLPIQFSIQQFYEQKLAKLDAECEQERIRKRLEAFQQAQQKTPVRPREPRVAAVSGLPDTAGRRTRRKPQNRTLRRRAGEQEIRPKSSAAGSVERENAANMGNTETAKSGDFGRCGEKAGQSRGVVRAPRRSHLPAVRAVSGIYEGVPKVAKNRPRALQNEKSPPFQGKQRGSNEKYEVNTKKW